MVLIDPTVVKICPSFETIAITRWGLDLMLEMNSLRHTNHGFIIGSIGNKPLFF